MHFSSVNPFLWIAGVELVLLNIVSFGVINHGYLALMPIQFLILGLWVLIFGDLYSQIKLKTVNGAMALLKMFGGALVTGYLLLIHVCFIFNFNNRTNYYERVLLPQNRVYQILMKRGGNRGLHYYLFSLSTRPCRLSLDSYLRCSQELMDLVRVYFITMTPQESLVFHCCSLLMLYLLYCTLMDSILFKVYHYTFQRYHWLLVY